MNTDRLKAQMSELLGGFRATRFSEMQADALADFLEPFQISSPVFPKMLPKHFMQLPDRF